MNHATLLQRCVTGTELAGFFAGASIRVGSEVNGALVRYRPEADVGKLLIAGAIPDAISSAIGTAVHGGCVKELVRWVLRQVNRFDA